MQLKLTPLYIFVILAFSTCRTDPESDLKEFALVPNLKNAIRDEIKGFRLGALDDRRELQKKVEGFRVMKKWGRDLEMPHLRVKIKKPSKNEFDFLKKHYGFGLSRIVYEEGKTYHLLDFMTPFMQAVNDKFFIQEKTRNYDLLASNCWTTGYEFVRTARQHVMSFYIFYAGAEQIKNQMYKSNHSKEIGRLSGGDPFPYQKMKYGDVLFFYNSEDELYHVAIYIDEGIFFEKVAVVSRAPYRLTLWEDFYHEGSPSDRIEIRRFHNAALPNPQRVMHTIRQTYNERDNSVDTKEVDLISREIFIIVGDGGRASLSPESYKAQFRRVL